MFWEQLGFEEPTNTKDNHLYFPQKIIRKFKMKYVVGC